MTTKQIYLEFLRLKENKNDYDPEVYQEKLRSLLVKLSNNCSPEFECEPNETESLTKLLSAI